MCAGLSCTENCRYCIEDLEWNDVGQDNRCQCHANGCDQCERGYFKIDYNFPCQSCDSFVGCKFCGDFTGCVQCEDDYQRTLSTDCGNDGIHSPNICYCKPKDGSECIPITDRPGSG